MFITPEIVAIQTRLRHFAARADFVAATGNVTIGCLKDSITAAKIYSTCYIN